MKYYYDLHIHSVLSACADVLMTPNNIINMAHIKGLHILAVTDHNSLKQLPIVSEIMESYEMLLVFGCEVALKDGSHILCYFKTLEEALTFDEMLTPYLVLEELDLTKYNEQVLTDIDDLKKSSIPDYLGNPTSLSFDNLVELTKPFDTLLVLAHVDRHKNSGIAYLFREEVDAVELKADASHEIVHLINCANKRILYSSDAHQLTDISEPSEKNRIELKSLTIDELFKEISNG